MISRLLGFRNYLILLAATLYLLASQQFGPTPASWLPILFLFVLSLTLSRTRLRLSAFGG
jgi:hypothetical protein